MAELAAEAGRRHENPIIMTAMDPVAEIKRLYYATTRATVQRDLDKPVALLKTMKT